MVSLEIRKMIEYRVDFFTNLALSLLSQLLIGYALWKAIFETGGGSNLHGYSFTSLMLYYVFAAIVGKNLTPELGFVSQDIYSGTLTKFLLYPISFVQYKLACQFAHLLHLLFQLGIAVGAFVLVFGLPSGIELSTVNFLLGCGALFVGMTLYTLLALNFELTAFWVDAVWSLGVILGYFVEIFGGKALPLFAFPEWLQPILRSLPFSYIVSFPIEVFTGRTSSFEILVGFLIGVTWCSVFLLTARIIWRRGVHQYTGVGI